MDIIEQFGEEPVAQKALRPQQYVVKEIQDAITSGCRRFFVLGLARSRRLAAVRVALGALGFKLAVIDLGFVRSRRDLDLACRRAALGAEFFAAMIKLERQAKRQRLAVVFHNFDGCFGSPGEDSVVDLVWMEAKNGCRGCKVIFTARNPDFVARCFRQFENCLGFVQLITYPCTYEGNLPSGQGKFRRKPS
jgi:hypothetical protein